MPVDAGTGSFGFTGRHITRRLLDSGRRVRTVTLHRELVERERLPRWADSIGPPRNDKKAASAWF
jgi:nucleoside-diphosphate-sugar epimerase